MPSIRSLPRIFLPGADPSGPIDLPKEERDKLSKVLRLHDGEPIAVLPNDGSLVCCEYRAGRAIPISVEWPGTEPQLHLTLAQALPKGDRLETVVRMCTEVGVARFVLFHADRSIVRWEAAKLAAKLRRYEVIARESAEQSFRCRLPEFEVLGSLAEVLRRFPDASVLSELESVDARLASKGDQMTIVVGPEGGWSPAELELIGVRGVTLGPLVLRTDTAGLAAAAALLLGYPIQ